MKEKQMRSKLLLTVVFFISLALAGVIQAQDDFAEAEVIAVAAQSDVFAAGLEMHPGWYAAAYDTENSYGVWRVQFWSAEGEDLGWADVNPERERLYSWEAYFGATDAQKEAAYSVLRDFVSAQPEILELVEDPSLYDFYVDFDGYADLWGVYIDRGAESLYVLVDFEDDFAFTNPELVRLYFSEVMSYDEWREGKGAEAAATAYAQPEIADAVRDVEGWQAAAEPAGSPLWRVSFLAGEDMLAWATVNIKTSEVVEYGVTGM